ncbi:MAG: hypothetical protein JNM56_12100 [Planctomycetia bacterium]|nr:hypothetical protein [Planctomycetia bacterium]
MPRFRAWTGRFDEPAERATMDDLAHWVEGYYAEDLKRRPSKHVYVRKLPEEIIGRIDRLREHPLILNAIAQQFDTDSTITPMKHTDELYISHYNRDLGGDHGLFSKHYDGNLRFLPYGAVVRALIYIQSDAGYTVVFGHSQVEKAFATYDVGLLDFHRELHWVVGEYQPSEKQRILLKCNYLICPANARLAKRAVLGMTTAVFYTVKAAMEYSKSPTTPPQVAVGLLCNLFRLMNNVHPLIPLVFILLVVCLVIGGGVWLVL